MAGEEATSGRGTRGSMSGASSGGGGSERSERSCSSHQQRSLTPTPLAPLFSSLDTRLTHCLSRSLLHLWIRDWIPSLGLVSCCHLRVGRWFRDSVRVCDGRRSLSLGERQAGDSRAPPPFAARTADGVHISKTETNGVIEAKVSSDARRGSVLQSQRGRRKRKFDCRCLRYSIARVTDQRGE